MSMTTARTLEKNMRREGVLDGELRELDLNRLPEINLNEDCDLEQLKEDIEAICKSIKFWVMEDDLDALFKSIDQSGDNCLTVDEVHRWFVRTKLKGCDIHTIKK
mmetsp:Transcript_54181/g.118134  ORF Transcript_54181/g.118134 Transcript_54181/m.118134 type:complete len:105 (+) Transcript_54181:636-950(+)